MGDNNNVDKEREALMDKFRKACLSRGVHGIKSIGKSFQIYDDNSDKMLSKDEFLKGVKDYQAGMAQAEVEKLFACFDRDNSGTLSFDEFLRGLRPPMSESRLSLIDKAFKIMDKTGDGVITVDDLTTVYDVSKHKKFVSGQWTKQQVLQEFLNNFQAGDKDEKVTKQEFVDYYAGVSASIDKDVYFDYMMRQSWKF